MSFKDLIKAADWKIEKHVPAIEVPSKVKRDDVIRIEVSVGKEIAHPNTTEHHIASVEVYFLPREGKFPYLIGRVSFSAHGSSAGGPDTSGVYTVPSAVISFKAQTSGTIYASSYCNIHGLWENSCNLTVE